MVVNHFRNPNGNTLCSRKAGEGETLVSFQDQVTCSHCLAILQRSVARRKIVPEILSFLRLTGVSELTVHAGRVKLICPANMTRQKLVLACMALPKLGQKGLTGQLNVEELADGGIRIWLTLA